MNNWDIAFIAAVIIGFIGLFTLPFPFNVLFLVFVPCISLMIKYRI